jgi:hypothetical protein
LDDVVGEESLGKVSRCNELSFYSVSFSIVACLGVAKFRFLTLSARRCWAMASTSGLRRAATGERPFIFHSRKNTAFEGFGPLRNFPNVMPRIQEVFRVWAGLLLHWNICF